MSNSNGINTLARSINGIITYADGSGTLIQNGKVITITLTANIITALKLFINNIDCNGILQIGSVTTTQIYISPAGRLVLGSSTCLNTFIQQNDSLLVGQSPETYDSDSKLMNAPNMRFENTNGQSLIDFHSNTLGSRTPDSRIIATGGGGSALSGTLALSSGNIYISSGNTTNISDSTTNINNITTNINSVNDINLTAASIIVSGQLNVISPVAYIAKQGFNNLEIGSAGVGSGDTYLNFHSSGNNISYDSKIVSTGGAATTGGATLTSYANIINLNALSTTTITSPITNITSTNNIVLTTPETKISMQGLNGIILKTSGAGSVNASINFYSSGLSPYASRILSFGGDSTVGNGRLEMYSGTIYVRPLGNLDMGTATSPNTFIRNTDGLIIGKDPISYNSALGTMDAPGMRFLNNGINSLIDFHSNNVGSTNLDSRIHSTGGTAAALNGTLSISSGTINLSAPTGINLSSYYTNVSAQGTNGLRMIADGTSACNTYIDFHSSGTGQASSRIMSQGGSATPFNGTLGISSGTISMTSETGDTNITSKSATTNLKGLDGCYLEVGNGGGNSLLDFHSNSTYNDFDARIMCNGASSGSNTTGVMSYSARQHIFSAGGGSSFSGTGGVRFNNGFSFNQGYFTSNMIYTGGGQAITRNLGAGSATTEFISFGMTFAGNVVITLAGYASDASSMGVVTNFYGTTTTGFTATFYNSRNVTAPANTYGLNWIATGNF